jgi:hypothetical protein
MRSTRKNPVLLILAILLLAGGCATTQTRQLGDNTEQQLSYSDQGPVLVKNSWAEVTLAETGFAGEPDEQFDLPFWWQFELKVKTGDLKTLTIYEVSAAPPRLILADPAVSLQDGNWRGQTAPEKFSRDAAPWFFAPGPTEHVFKIVLTNAGNEERILYQPCLHSEAAKKAQVTEIVRLTAPEIKVKRRQASSAPKQNPTQFNVFLPKTRPTPERSYSMSGGKNQQAVAITISPKGE